MQVSGVALLIPKPDGKAVLEIAGRAAFELNPVATIVWERLAAGRPTQEIISELVSRFSISKDQATDDVTNFMEILKQYLLVYDDTQL